MKLLSKYKYIIITILLVAIFIIIGFVVIRLTPNPVLDRAMQALAGSTNVAVSQLNGIITFTPARTHEKGLIYYPGGLVDPVAYAPTCLDLANSGILCAIVSFPLNLGILNTNAANQVLNQNTAIKSWYIAGHSLGGVSAARFIQANPNRIQGLILLGSYSDVDISNLVSRSLSIFASADGLLDTPQVKNNAKNLPINSLSSTLVGANHAQFGWYGLQSGDGQASISNEDQQQQTSYLLINFINN